MLFAEHHQIALLVAELSALRNALRPVGKALNTEDLAALMSTVSTWPAASTVFGQVAMELFCLPVLRIGEAIVCLGAHVDWMTFQPHTPSDLVLCDDSVIAVQLWQFGVSVSVPLDVAVDCRGITIQAISDIGILASRHLAILRRTSRLRSE